MTLRTDPETGEVQFSFGNDWRTLSDPHGLPTPRQLAKLNRLGLLGFRSHRGEPLSKLECARAIDRRQTC
jgi:hypothetical protein